MTKRLFDIVTATFGLFLFAPVLVIISGLILLDDGAPVLYRQQRLGRHQLPFTVVKFRSMRDGRVTRIGRWIRASGLDEVLQFFNVLYGQMSVVGPRPLTEIDVERLQLSNDFFRWLNKPGVTGLAQIYAGKGARMNRFLDESYAKRESIFLDIKIIAISFMINCLGKRRVKSWLSQCIGLRRQFRRYCQLISFKAKQNPIR